MDRAAGGRTKYLHLAVQFAFVRFSRRLDVCAGRGDCRRRDASHQIASWAVSLADLVATARSLVSGARVLLGSADLAGALNFVAMTALRSRTPIRVKICS